MAIEAAAGAPFAIVRRVRDNRLVEALVTAGLGIGTLPRFSTRPGGGIVLVPLAGPPTGRTVSALARRDVAERTAVRHALDTPQRCAAAIAGADALSG